MKHEKDSKREREKEDEAPRESVCKSERKIVRER